MDPFTVTSMKNYYNVLRGKTGIFCGKAFGNHVPLKVAFFSWSVVLGWILMADDISKRGVIIFEWCFIYKTHGESVNNLFLHYAMARELWSMIFCLFGVS